MKIRKQSYPCHASCAFTLVEALAVIVVVLLLVFLFMPRLSHDHGRSARMMQDVSQVRGLHRVMLMFSETNNGYFPGMNARGELLDDDTVANRYMLMLKDNYVVPAYLISPIDKRKKPWEQGPLTTANYSFALLNLSVNDSPRLDEWKDTQNANAIAISGRMYGKDSKGKMLCPWPRSNGEWIGSVGWNDNHVTFEATHDRLDTQYGDQSFENDNLFDTVGASMVYQGMDGIIDSESGQ